MPPVIVRPSVVADVLAAVSNSRAILGQVLLDLHNDLPLNLTLYQSNRLLKNPTFFWYTRTYSLNPHAFSLRQLRFVVRDADPSMLEVIWVVM